jgi:hypothetical protein
VSKSDLQADNSRRSKRLRAAWSYATAARLFNAWLPHPLERAALGRGAANKNNNVDDTTHAFLHWFKGGLPHANTIKAVCDRYTATADTAVGVPASQRLWHFWHGPLAAILCEPSKGLDHIRTQLELLPRGNARAAIWDENWLTVWGERLHLDVPDSPELITSLADCGTYEALLALVGKMRLRQLQGQLDHEVDYENAIWKVLPSAIGSSAQLSLARYELIDAVHKFLTWPPFWGTRKLAAELERPSYDELLEHVRRAEQHAIFNGINLPPREVLDRYSASQRCKPKCSTNCQEVAFPYSRARSASH